MGEKTGTKWRHILYKLKKNQMFGRAFLKNIEQNLKNEKFWFFDFRRNIQLEVVLPTSKCKPWIVLIILSIFLIFKIFSIGVLVYSLKDLTIAIFAKIFNFWEKNQKRSSNLQHFK
jgi:hypothetical protein